MMRNVSALMIWGIVLCALAILLGGCGEFAAQPGETAAEGRRRHIRTTSVYNDSIWLDIDRTVLFMDKPSSATDMRIPPRIDE
ncbi:MAG: hypothetical protein ACYSSO_02910 [Planctomycetota bacterium]|jgi:hypothetical protein